MLKGGEKETKEEGRGRREERGKRKEEGGIDEWSCEKKSGSSNENPSQKNNVAEHVPFSGRSSDTRKD